MAGKSDYLEQALLNHTFRTATFSKPTNTYVGLHTGDPTDVTATALANEVTGGSYARVAVSSANASWDAPAVSGTTYYIANTGAVTFPSPTGNWGTVTHFSIFDASTTGNLLYLGALTTSRNIQNGDNAPSFAAGALTISED